MVPSPLGFGRKPRGEVRPRSFHPFVLATNREVKEGRSLFIPSVLATNQEVREGRGPFTPRFLHQTER